jgi:hypothetical protein
MNNQQKRAGQSTREMAAKRHKKRIWFAIVSVVIVILIVLIALNPKFLKIGGFTSIGLLLVARVFMNYSDGKDRQLRKEEKRAVRGAKGEEKIGSILDSLGEEYLVLHDIESPYGNIDHVVITKQNGVFLIETKAHGGKVSVVEGRLLVNGHDPEKDFIAQCLHNTYWLRDKICDTTSVETWIVPVLVFTNASVERMTPIKGVTVVNKKYLVNILQKANNKKQNVTVWENREQIVQALTIESNSFKRK